MGELQSLPNIGEKLEHQLHKAGIDTIEELKRTGSREAWLRILAFDPSACIMRLSALEGAIQGVRWHRLNPEMKAELKAFYHQHK
ncbi:MAG TPA: competence protein TfoX [Firmicutes bacterium]|jgi:DNA transformation protein|nr:competence protein TfoX [Bacillota bacterium]